MKIAIETVGIFIISLFFMSIPVLCTLSFVYNWYGCFKLILIVACLVDWVVLSSMLVDIADMQD